MELPEKSQTPALGSADLAGCGLWHMLVWCLLGSQPYMRAEPRPRGCHRGSPYPYPVLKMRPKNLTGGGLEAAQLCFVWQEAISVPAAEDAAACISTITASLITASGFYF